MKFNLPNRKIVFGNSLIGVGARGGRGSTGTGITLGALVRGVIELRKGDQLYFMVGQEGVDACSKVSARNILLTSFTYRFSYQIGLRIYREKMFR